jgi:hypothetical protein
MTVYLQSVDYCLGEKTMITVKTVFMHQLHIVHSKSLLGFSTNGAGFLCVNIEGVGQVTLGSTKATEAVLNKCKEMMLEIKENSDNEYLINDDTFKGG